MQKTFKRSASVLAVAAAVSLAAPPALANHRGWRDRDDIDAGDVITGLLIIGGIAAIASAAGGGNNRRDRDRDRAREQRERDYRYEQERERDYRTRDGREDPRGYGNDARPEWQESRGIDAAVNRCVGEIERGSQRVESVDQVSRDGQGWRIAGQTNGGVGYACSIDGEGRIRSATLDGAAI